jgi:uncharacterized protein (TIGR02246 family)
VIEQWDEAWSHQDADALAELHHPDAETVNRFGQYLHGREEHQQQLRWLHTGPFRASQSPPQKVVGLRWIRPDVALVQRSGRPRSFCSRGAAYRRRIWSSPTWSPTKAGPGA